MSPVAPPSWSDESRAAPTRREPTRREHSGKPLDERTLLWRWTNARDERARAMLVRHYAPLTRSLARRYGNSSEPFDDLLQVAQLGLVKALDRYDPTRGAPFKSFAVPTILGEMRRYFRDCGWAVHVPRGAQERALLVRDAEQRLSENHGHAPTVNELAEYLELSVEQVIDARRALHAYRTGSLDAPRHGAEDDGDSTYADVIGAEDGRYELVELAMTAGVALKQLTSRQRDVLRLRFVDELSQTEIAKRIGVSQMQVSRLLKKSLEELRALAEASDGGPDTAGARQDS
ncbi:MAG TPA: SigB/SigF/SigG family RNA polymerase sigma factor [Solirubrobacteraceae bacterium]|nr:SigB/SigF/SigG family RNA polymerase sigma factor [Solirubrobacteraceae bacterium]